MKKDSYMDIFEPRMNKPELYQHNVAKEDVSTLIKALNTYMERPYDYREDEFLHSDKGWWITWTSEQRAVPTTDVATLDGMRNICEQHNVEANVQCFSPHIMDLQVNPNVRKKFCIQIIGYVGTTKPTSKRTKVKLSKRTKVQPDDSTDVPVNDETIVQTDIPESIQSN